MKTKLVIFTFLVAAFLAALQLRLVAVPIDRDARDSDEPAPTPVAQTSTGICRETRS